jgi:hypothetical protein
MSFSPCRRRAVGVFVALHLAALVIVTANRAAGSTEPMNGIRFSFADSQHRLSKGSLTNAEAPGELPKITRGVYGADILASAENPARSFTFTVPSAGRYAVRFGGTVHPEGGCADLLIDNKRVGDYRFFSFAPNDGPTVTLPILDLAAGNHTLMLKWIGPGNGFGDGSGSVLSPAFLDLIDLDKVTSSKTRSTIYTAAKIAAARKNITRYDWAKEQRDVAEKAAAPYVGLGYEGLWNLVPSALVPRAIHTNSLDGNLSPIVGKALDETERFPWKSDPLKDPWKLTDPVSKYRFPTNDYGAFYRSGLDENGNFHPENADRKLLVNTLYPEKGPTWGVDDGYGWTDPETKKRYTFIAYYCHWGLWWRTGDNPGVITQALNSLRDAYVYTGDLRYARAGIVLLDRVADIYPTLDTTLFDNAAYYNSNGGRPAGKAIGCIWETGMVKDLVSAYDAFYPAMDDAEAVAFLKGKGQQFHLPFKENGTQLRRNVEDSILRQVYEGVKDAHIVGNTGFHQSALAMAAVVLDTLPETKEWLDFNFQAGGLVKGEDRFQVTGGNLLATLVNDVDRDGHGNEASPGYNGGWLSSIRMVADVLDGYDRYPEADLYKNVKFRKLFLARYPLILIDKYSPRIGDYGDTGQIGLPVGIPENAHALEKFGDPVFAQVAYLLNGNKTDGIRGDIFSPEPEKVQERIQAVITRDGPLPLTSTNQTAYGFAALRNGKRDDGPMALRDLWVYYGRNGGHGHRDTLNLGLNAFGLDLLPDLGYPEQANNMNRHRHEWMNNTISHNTVVVDGQKQQTQIVSLPLHFDDVPNVKLIDIDAPEVFPQVKQYQRTTALIPVDATTSYAVDLFRVSGGKDHYFSFHAAEGPVTSGGLNLIQQALGTYAGPNVPFGEGAKDYPGVAGTYQGSGFHWLDNVTRDPKPKDNFSIDWAIQDTWKVLPQEVKIHLRLTMLGDIADVALADGHPPRRQGIAKTLRYLVVHRTGKDLRSVFTSVIEPYQNTRVLKSIEPTTVTAKGTAVDPFEVRALKIERIDGQTDYVISALKTDTLYTIEGRIPFQGSFGVYSEKNGKPVYAYLNDGTVLGEEGTGIRTQGRITGKIVEFTRDVSQKNTITVQIPGSTIVTERFTGRDIYVHNDGKRSAVYRIHKAEVLGDGKYRLDIGEQTLVRSYAQNTDLQKGFIYDIAAGQSFYIPLSQEFPQKVKP